MEGLGMHWARINEYYYYQYDYHYHYHFTTTATTTTTTTTTTAQKKTESGRSARAGKDSGLLKAAKGGEAERRALRNALS